MALKIQELLLDKDQGVNFKKAVRQMNGIWDRNDNQGVDAGEIYDHEKIPISTWKSYLNYLQILQKNFLLVKLIHKGIIEKVIELQNSRSRIVVSNNKLKSKEDKIRKIKILSLLYKTAMVSSLNSANLPTAKGTKFTEMKNIWDILGVKPFECSRDFVLPSNKNRPRIRQFLKVIWKNYYERNGDMCYFTQLERLKCINWLVDKVLVLSKVREDLVGLSNRIPHFPGESYMKDVFFPLHEVDRLYGQSCG